VKPERWQRLNEIFERVIATPATEQAALLDALTGADAELRRAAAAMVAADREAGAFLERPPVAPPTADGAASGAVTARLPAQVGRYQIAGWIGRGGFGEVLRGFDPVLKREVAVKLCRVVDAEVARSFSREAEIAAGLSHPRIATIYDFGVAEGVPYLVQELLGGEDLADLIARQPMVPLATRLGWLAQVAEALVYAHARGVVHRDVKPGNVRLLTDGTVKLLDFGIAHHLTAAGEEELGGRVVGTAAYMAPEQIRGEAVDARADVYAFGCLAYEALTSRRAIAGETGAAQLFAALHEGPRPIRTVWAACPPALARLVDGCLARSPVDRPPGLDALAGELAAMAAGIVPGRVARGRLPGGLVVAAAALLLVGVAGVWRALSPAGPPGPATVASRPPAAAPVLGRLQVDARPWAEVVAVERDGASMPLPTPPFTPLALATPAGDYTVELRHPRRADTVRCSVRVAAGATARCLADLVALDAVGALRKAGL
jgi:hypothetical protein